MRFADWVTIRLLLNARTYIDHAVDLLGLAGSCKLGRLVVFKIALSDEWTR